MIKTFIADDHVIVRRGLRQIIADTPEITIADEAGTGQETIQKVLSNSYDVVLLDITMPDINGLDILKEIKQQKPETRILILSMHPEEQFAIRALKAGASGYLTKDSAPAELVSAIKKCSRRRQIRQLLSRRKTGFAVDGRYQQGTA
jgi:DNA-binding NarL/FixJ family response regulator